MSVLTLAWSMCAAASIMLGLIHFVLWQHEKQTGQYLLATVMAFGSAATALIELNLARADSVGAYAHLLRWENVSIFLILVPMVWFVHHYFGTGRRWLALSITALWVAGILVNFLVPVNLTFSEIAELKPLVAFWGEGFVVPVGTNNPWKLLADLASILILGYTADAAIRLWKRDRSRRALTIGGSIVLFILVAGIHTPLVDAGLVATPYMVSFAFLSIVVAMTYEVTVDAISAAGYEKEIRANESRWRTLLDNVHLAVVDIDPEQRIHYANPYFATLVGQSPDALRGQPIVRFLRDSERAELEHRLRLAAQRGPRMHSRWPIVSATGELRQLDWSSVGLRDAEARFSGVLSIGADVTEQLEAQKELQETQRQMDRLARASVLGELASALAHELNQPLTAILSNAQAARRFLAADNPDMTEIKDILDDIARDDKRAGEVIHGLHRLLRKGEITRESFDPKAAIEEILELHRGELETQDIELVTELAGALPPIHGSRVEIQQVVMNLLSNAIRTCGDLPRTRRKVHLRAGIVERSVRIEVRDWGAGVPPAKHREIFNAFVSDSPNGIGMGLAICRRIVEAHGGRIWVDNPDDGGARFAFVLPAQMPAEAVAIG